MKLPTLDKADAVITVALFTGAWVETWAISTVSSRSKVALFTGA
nr:hypothetical protein [Caballeronia sordidicola]